MFSLDLTSALSTALAVFFVSRVVNYYLYDKVCNPQGPEISSNTFISYSKLAASPGCVLWQAQYRSGGRFSPQVASTLG